MNHLVLVTGASKGIGRAVTCQLAIDGFNIGVHYHRDTTGTQETLNTIIADEGNGHLLSFDVANREQRREVLEHEIVQHGVWCGMVSNVGIARDATSPALNDDDRDVVIHTNLDSFCNVVQPRIMPMIGSRQGGRIIMLSSISNAVDSRSWVNYSTAKAEIIGVVKALAIKLAKREVTVSCITSRPIDTGMIEIEESALEEAMSMIPMKHMGQAEEVAGPANHLMSDIAGYVTRRAISINGGVL